MREVNFILSFYFTNLIGGILMGLRIGQGYKGSPSILTSTANVEVIPSPPSDWTKKYSFYKFSFMNTQACTVKINGGDPIFLDANQGFEINEIDWPIYSFVIVQSGIQYQFLGAF